MILNINYYQNLIIKEILFIKVVIFTNFDVFVLYTIPSPILLILWIILFYFIQKSLKLLSNFYIILLYL